MRKEKTFWQLLTEFKIEVPNYQRDYVQGWVDTAAGKSADRYEEQKIKAIREGFVTALFHAIKEQKPLNLNLVFGAQSGSKHYFVPVDGQQRLTTLFLAHWYIALRAHQLQANKQQFEKFTYQTRTTSSDFFNILCRFNFSADNVATCVKNDNNFFSQHLTDPTVLSALVMIQSIETVFQNLDYKIAFDYLISDSCKINFDIINLGDYKLTDDLYIKLNGRGKPLTYFEQFKAWLPDYIRDCENTTHKIEIKEPYNNALSGWQLLIDTHWLDLFWKYKDNNDFIIDQEFMRFFNGMFQLSIAASSLSKDDKENDSRIKLFNNVSDKHELELPFDMYEKLHCINTSSLNEIFDVLKLLAYYDTKLSSCLSDINFFTKTPLGKNTLLLDFIQGEITYADKLRFYALTQYLLCNKEPFGDLKFKRWIRVLRNLIENTEISNENVFIRAVQRIGLLAKESSEKDILDFLQQNPDYNAGPFLDFQTKEEVRKAHLILNDPAWEPEIITAEQHSYFKGQISFLLVMANDDPAKFITYRDKAMLLFAENGLVSHADFLLHRALLTKGNYLYELTASRFGFCKNQEQWRLHIFRDIDTTKGRVKLLQLLLDDISLQNAEADLKRIIDNFNSYDWRIDMIKEPTVLRHDEFYEKLICKYSDEQIYLLNKSQMSSFHRELRSWCFFKDYIIGKTFAPFDNVRYNFTYHDEEPFVYLSGFEYGAEQYAIKIIYTGKDTYTIALLVVKAKSDEKALLDNICLSASLGMSYDNNTLKLICATRAATEQRLRELCNKLLPLKNK